MGSDRHGANWHQGLPEVDGFSLNPDFAELRVLRIAVVDDLSSIWQVWLEEDIRCGGHEGPLWAVASTGERNTLIFWKRWSVGNEVSYQDLLFG
jgi:hypothetical protein